MGFELPTLWLEDNVLCSSFNDFTVKSPSENFNPINTLALPTCVSSAINCGMSEWSEWSECTKSCGKGHTVRTRTVTLEPQFGGDHCSETTQKKKCKIRKCGRGQASSDEKKRRREQREKRRSKLVRPEFTSEHPGQRAEPPSTPAPYPRVLIGV